MIIFAQLCYCIYYENYYNSFIMKNKKKSSLIDLNVFRKVLIVLGYFLINC